MIDIQGPQKKLYSDEERADLSVHFVLLLHTLLVVYLCIHNLIIPVISNVLRSHNLFLDVHYWFLFQVPVQWWLRKGRGVPEGYFMFLVVGSAARLLFEVSSLPTLRSWGVLSILISELSSFIFYFIYWPQLKKKKFVPLALLGIFVAPALGLLEFHGHSFVLPQAASTKTRRAMPNDLGCKGHAGELGFPLEPMMSSSSALISDCGLSEKVLYGGESFVLRNTLGIPVNLRLYQLKVLHGKVSWRFVRLARIKEYGSWPVSSHFKNAPLYLIKSPEHRRLGHMVIVPPGTKHFPLGRGQLSFDYDSVKWESL